MRRLVQAAVVATGLAVVVACGGGGPTTTAADPFPERPYVLDVARAEPCAALTEPQRTNLDLREGSGGSAQGGTSRGCAWPGRLGIGYTVQTLAVDASAALGAEPTSTVVEVAGFGAVQSAPPAEGTGLPFCQVVLDVADGASLRAQVQVTPLAPDAEQRTVERTCEQVRAVAELMIDNLHARQSP